MAPAAGASSGMWNLARQRVDARRESIYRLRAVEDADLEVIRASLPRSQVRQLAALTGIEAASVAVGRRLHGHAICALAEHPPHRVEWELALLIDLVGAEAEAAVDDRHRDGSAGLGRHVVLVALFRKTLVRPGEPPVVTRQVLGHRHAGRRRDQVLGALIDDRPAHVHVVEVHVGRWIEAGVDDLVVHREPALANSGLDPPVQLHRLAIYRRLADDAFGPQHALVTIPALAVAGEPRGDQTDPAMEPVLLGGFDELVEVRGVVNAAEQRVVEAARDQHAAAPGAKPAEAHRLGEPRADDAGGREPRERAAVELTSTHVHRPIHEHIECVAAPGPELEHPHAAFDPITERHQPDPRDLFQATHPAHQIAPGGRPTAYGGHG